MFFKKFEPNQWLAMYIKWQLNTRSTYKKKTIKVLKQSTRVTSASSLCPLLTPENEMTETLLKKIRGWYSYSCSEAVNLEVALEQGFLSTSHLPPIYLLFFSSLLPQHPEMEQGSLDVIHTNMLEWRNSRSGRGVLRKEADKAQKKKKKTPLTCWKAPTVTPTKTPC